MQDIVDVYVKQYKAAEGFNFMATSPITTINDVIGQWNYDGKAVRDEGYIIWHNYFSQTWQLITSALERPQPIQHNRQ